MQAGALHVISHQKSFLVFQSPVWKGKRERKSGGVRGKSVCVRERERHKPRKRTIIGTYESRRCDADAADAAAASVSTTFFFSPDSGPWRGTLPVWVGRINSVLLLHVFNLFHFLSDLLEELDFHVLFADFSSIWCSFFRSWVNLCSVVDVIDLGVVFLFSDDTSLSGCCACLSWFSILFFLNVLGFFPSQLCCLYLWCKLLPWIMNEGLVKWSIYFSLSPVS